MSMGEVRAIRTPQGFRHAVFDGAGRMQGKPSKSRADAEEKLEVFLMREKARRDNVTRPCLCCLKPFESEGKHNRLCDYCRQKY